MAETSRPRAIPLWRQRRVQIAAGAAAFVLIAGVAAFALGGGSGDTDDTDGTAGRSTTTREKATTTEAGETTTTVEPAIAPLTGLPDPTLAVLVRPALSVKIDNVNLAKRPPQAGLDVADVVYEEPVESATRFVAVFHSTSPPRVGPVRSTRYIDPGIVWPIRGLYLYSGGTAPKVAAIRGAPVQTIDENGLQNADARIRDPDFSAPHNLFGVPDKLWPTAQDHTPPQPLFLFRAEGEASTGDPATTIQIPTFSQARYTWDAGKGVWLREELLGGGGSPQPHMAESGEQIAPANVIVQRISGTEDKSVMLGEGDAWILSDGKVVRGRWARPTLESRTVFVDAAGVEVKLTPGTTWVHLITGGDPTIV